MKMTTTAQFMEMSTWINRHLPSTLHEYVSYDKPFEHKDDVVEMTILHEVYHLQFLAYPTDKLGCVISGLIYIDPSGEQDEQCPNDIVGAMSYAAEQHARWEDQLLTKDPLEDDPFVCYGSDAELDRLRYEEKENQERITKLQTELTELDDIYWMMSNSLAEQTAKIAQTLTKLELLYETLNDYTDPTMTFIRKQLHYIREELVADE